MELEMSKNDRNKRLLRELLLEIQNTEEPSLSKFIEELSEKYEVYLKRQNNQFRDE